MSYRSDVAISMSHNIRYRILHQAESLYDVEEHIIDKIKNPDIVNEHVIFIQFDSINWLHYADVIPTINLIEETIRSNPKEARLVVIGSPDMNEIGEYDAVRCFYPLSFIEVEEPED